MPNGYGIYHCVPKQRPGGYSDPCEGTLHTAQDEKLLASVPPPKRSEDFAAAAEVAVKALAERHGASFGPPLVPCSPAPGCWCSAPAACSCYGAVYGRSARAAVRIAASSRAWIATARSPCADEPDRALQQE